MNHVLQNKQLQIYVVFDKAKTSKKIYNKKSLKQQSAKGFSRLTLPKKFNSNKNYYLNS